MNKSVLWHIPPNHSVFDTGEPLKILYTHRTQGRGAEGLHICHIVNALTAMGHTVDIHSPPGIDPRKEAGAPPVDKAVVKTRGIKTVWKIFSKNLPNFIFELIEIAYNIPAWFSLNKILRSGSYDLIYERYAFYMICGALLAKKYRIPFILEANEVSGIENRARPQSFPGLCKIFEHQLFKRCTGIVTVSSYLKKMICEQRVPAEMVSVVPNAINLGDIDVDPVKIGQLRTTLKIEGCTTIGFAGWFDKWDRLDFMLEVFRRLIDTPNNETTQNLRLLLIGDGPALHQVRQLAIDLKIEKCIVFTGGVSRKDIFNYLALLDIALLPHSNKFGSPVILFELMGLGIPVAAPLLPPIEDVLTDGETGVLFKPMDKIDCYSALLRLLNNPDLRKKISAQARNIVATKHTWIKNAQTALDLTLKGPQA
jgi:glycosyltransferase involved in cell wall biosynthesis